MNKILWDWHIINPNFFAIATIPLPKVWKICLRRHFCFSKCILFGNIMHYNINVKKWCDFSYRIGEEKFRRIKNVIIYSPVYLFQITFIPNKLCFFRFRMFCFFNKSCIWLKNGTAVSQVSFSKNIQPFENTTHLIRENLVLRLCLLACL